MYGHLAGTIAAAPARPSRMCLWSGTALITKHHMHMCDTHDECRDMHGACLHDAALARPALPCSLAQLLALVPEPLTEHSVCSFEMLLPWHDASQHSPLVRQHLVSAPLKRKMFSHVSMRVALQGRFDE